MLKQVENMIIESKWNCVLNDQNNVKEMAKLLIEHSCNDVDYIQDILDYKIFNITDSVKFTGKDIIEEYVYDYIENLAETEINNDLFLSYFDYESYIDDLFLSGEFTIIENSKVSIVINNFW